MAPADADTWRSWRMPQLRDLANLSCRWRHRGSVWGATETEGEGHLAVVTRPTVNYSTLPSCRCWWRGRTATCGRGTRAACWSATPPAAAYSGTRCAPAGTHLPHSGWLFWIQLCPCIDGPGYQALRVRRVLQMLNFLVPGSWHRQAWDNYVAPRVCVFTLKGGPRTLLHLLFRRRWGSPHVRPMQHVSKTWSQLAMVLRPAGDGVGHTLRGARRRSPVAGPRLRLPARLLHRCACLSRKTRPLSNNTSLCTIFLSAFCS